MIIENLRVRRVVIHEVFKRDDDRNQVPPRFGTQIEPLNDKALEALHDRIITSLGKTSRSLEMEIISGGDGSMVSIGRNLLNAADGEFVARSQAAAQKLADAQTRRDIPGGILVVFTGEVGHPLKRMFGVIKAEPQDGFAREDRDGRLSMRFLTDLILTPQARLYKIGLFVEQDSATDPARGFRAFVFDEQMTASNRETAAQYFYEAFLGCAFPQSGAHLTKKFYDKTKEFISKLEIPEDQKIDLYQGLYTYLKVDQSPTIEVATFSQRYLPNHDMRDSYESFMRRQDFPANAIRKDITDISNKLRRRRLKFRSDAQFTAPADKWSDLVHVQEVDGNPDGAGIMQRYTVITVKDVISTQE